MLQVKVFKSLEFNFDEMAKEANQWIAKHEIDAIDIRVQIAPQSPGESSSLGSSGDSDLVCYVVYRV